MTWLVFVALSLLATVIYGGGQWLVVRHSARWSAEQQARETKHA